MRAEPGLSPEPAGRWGQSLLGLQVKVAISFYYTQFTLDVSEPSACRPLGATIDGAANGLCSTSPPFGDWCALSWRALPESLTPVLSVR